MHILMTGATGGMGFVVCKDFMSQGYNITNISRSNSTKVGLLTREALRKNVKFRNIQHDFSQNMDVVRWSNIIGLASEYDHLVIIHGNCLTQDILNLDYETIEMSMKVNFIGPFSLCQYLLKGWTSAIKKDRSITYTSSVATVGGAPDEVAYHASKRAMQSGILSIARQFAKDFIRANVVSPGLLNTDLGRKTLTRRPDILKRIPLMKLTDIYDVSRMIKALTLSPTITGQNIHINAGRYLTI